MSNTIIQIKRSTTTDVPNNLQPGELAYTSNGQVLFIGSVEGSNTANVIAIAGQRTPGALTANQALVPNANAFVNEIRTNKLVIDVDGGTSNVSAISTDSTISGANDSGTVLLTANAVKAYVAASGFYGLNTSDGTNSNTLLSNSTAQDTLTIQGTTNEVTVALAGDTFTIGLPDSVTVTNALTVNTANVTDTTASSNTTTGALKVAGGLGVAGRINAADAAFGNTSVYSSVNGTIITTGDVLATNTVNASVLSVGSSVVANGSGVYTTGVFDTSSSLRVGNSSVNATANATTIKVSNATTNTVISSQGIDILTVGGNLRTNIYQGTGNFYGASGGELTTITYPNITVGNMAAGEYLEANNTIIKLYRGDNTFIVNTTSLAIGNSTVNTIVNTTSVSTGTLNITTANITNIVVSGNASFGDSSADVVSIVGAVNTSIMPQANVTYNLGNNTIRWAEIHAQNVHSVTGKFDGSVEIAGNLTVSGNVVTVNVSTLVVTDPLIQLASNNTTSDIIDIGFFGSYETGSGPHEHAGLFRDATDGIFKLFKDLTDSPTTTVNTADVSYATATLEAYLSSGGLTTNATSVIITANSTVNVAFVANTLSLSTPLAGNSGGTGLNSYTAEDLLVANSSNGFRKITLGASGTILQSNGTSLIYASLDGGTF